MDMLAVTPAVENAMAFAEVWSITPEQTRTPFDGTPSVYGADSRPNVFAMVASVVVAATILSVFLTIGIVQAIRDKPVATLVRLVPEVVELPPPPPPPRAPDVRPEVVLRTPSPVVAPEPLVTMPTQPVSVTTSPAPAPEESVPGPPSPAAHGPSQAIANGGDLSSQMISAPPPRYPTESRRHRESGTVVLSVLLSADGTVADIGIARSSGFDRLDRAALNAVRRWRWSPTMRNGAAVMVRGTVEIPFVLS